MFGKDIWPSRTDLDAVENKRPVAIIDIDGHSCWVNTRALEKAGYHQNTIDPQGGTIMRDKQGHPTGILFEKASGCYPPERTNRLCAYPNHPESWD